MKPQASTVHMLTKKRQAAGGDFAYYEIVALETRGLPPIKLPSPASGDLHNVRCSMPAGLVQRLHGFVRRNLIESDGALNNFDSLRFMLYVSGLSSRSTGRCRRLDFKALPTPVRSMEPHRPYLMQRTTEGTAEGAISITPTACLTMLPMPTPEFVVTKPELVIVQASALMQAYGLNAFSRMLEANSD